MALKETPARLVHVFVLDAIGATLLGLGLVGRFVYSGLFPAAAWLPDALIVLGLVLTVVATGLLVRRVAAMRPERT